MPVRVEIFDEDEAMLIDTPGEVNMQGASVMDGYWRQPELTAEHWLTAGFTGDIGVRGNDGLSRSLTEKKT